MSIKLMTIVGARPQFVKAAVVSRAIQEHSGFEEVLVHTGQHFDENMSAVFFDELGIPAPSYQLNISGSSHGKMTGKMLSAIEEVILEEKPDMTLLYGDTNSTLAGALASSKLHVPVAHVEAGLRSYNKRMPEEINRILTDHVSDLLFCPTKNAVTNLTSENITAGVHIVGDVMYDAALLYSKIAAENSNVLEEYGLEENGFVLVTCHRQENTDSQANMEQILGALNEIAKIKQVVFPLHPRTKNKITAFGYEKYLQNIKVLEPVPFFDMIMLESKAELILTDSGGIQKEAFFFKKPCITMRQETEWTETVELGANTLVASDRTSIIDAVENVRPFPQSSTLEPYGDGKASQKIVKLIGKRLASK